MKESIPSPCPKCGDPVAEDAPESLCPKCVLAEAATELLEPGATNSKRTPPPSVAEVAAQFPELEIVELIGVGGMGAVYKARQPKLNRVVALKILSHEMSEDPAFTERFNREGRVLARLSHPNIVAVYDTGAAGPFAFLLMEYVDGVNLRQAMSTGGFTPTEALTLVEEICTALKFAHGEGILHRDIKPENILIDSRGSVKIADFGIAKLVDQDEHEDVTLTLEGSILGSLQYMAPEQLETPGDIDQRADIYSLGVVFYEMLTGELPMGRFALPSEKSAMDVRIDDIVLRTLAKEREARFQTAGEVQTQVEAIHATPAHPRSSSSAASGKGDRLSLVANILFGLALVFVALILLDPGNASDDSDATLQGVERITLYVWIGVSLVTVAAIFSALHRYRSWQRKTHGALPFPSAVESWTSMGLNSGGMAKFATASAILTGLGLLLCGWTLFLWKDIEGSVYTTGGWVNYFMAAFLPPLIPSVLGIFLGAKAVHAVRLSGGQLGGFFRSVFAVMTMPILVGAGLLVLLFATQLGWYQMPSLGILKRDTHSETEWRLGEAEFALNLKVAAQRLATFELVHRDSSGKERVLEDFQGYTLASDSAPWHGVLKIGALPDGTDGRSAPALPKGGGKGVGFVIESAAGKQLAVEGGVPRFWVLDEGERADLDLDALGEHSFTVARRPAETASLSDSSAVPSDSAEVLLLRVSSLPRKVFGVPATVFDLYVQAESVFGLGGEIEWTRKLMEGLEASLPKDPEFRPPPVPEPDWNKGKPELDLTLAVAPGLVATFELVITDGNGQETALDRDSVPSCYLVVSDLETWKGTVKLGTHSANGDGAEPSQAQLRIDGAPPYPTFAVEMADAANWALEEKTSSLELSTPGVQRLRLGKTRVGGSGSSAKTVSLRVTTIQRSSEPQAPSVLAVHSMGLGHSEDWLYQFLNMIETIEGMDRGSSESPVEQALPEIQEPSELSVPQGLPK